MLWHEAATRSADQSVGTRGRRSRRILHWFSGCRICSLFNTAASVQRFISPATETMCFRDPRASRVRGSPRCSQPGVTIDPSVKVRLLPSINPAQSRIRPDIWSYWCLRITQFNTIDSCLKEYFTKIWKLTSCCSKTLLFPSTKPHISYNKSG